MNEKIFHAIVNVEADLSVMQANADGDGYIAADVDELVKDVRVLLGLLRS